jgi:hypothetical protein
MNDHFLGRLIDVVMNPNRLMANVAENPRWWQPVLLISLLLGAFTYVTLPISGPEQLEAMRDSKFMSMVPESEWQNQYNEALNPSQTKRILNSISGGVSAGLMVMGFSFVISFFVRMSGGVGTKTQGMGVGAWSALIPFGVASIIKLPLIMMTESVFAVNIGLAALLPDAGPQSKLFMVLSTYGDFITWWGVVVMVLGFERVYVMSRNAAATSVILPWAMLSMIPLGLGLIFM